MAFSAFEPDDSEVMSEINMIPLIDVMLVLLIVFMITVPVLTHSVQVQLPQASSQPERMTPEAIRLSVDANGTYRWNDDAVGLVELEQRLVQAAQAEPPTPVHLSGDKAAAYEHVAKAMAAAQRAGIRQLAFVTEP